MTSHNDMLYRNRYKAWWAAASPVRDMSTSELLGLFADLRAGHGPAILQVSDSEWWRFNRRERLHEVADEIDRRMPTEKRV